MRRLIRIGRNLFGRNGVERDLADEVRAAVEQLSDEKVRAGADASEARRLAAIELGGVESVKAQVREVRAGAVVDTLALARARGDPRQGGFDRIGRGCGFSTEEPPRDGERSKRQRHGDRSRQPARSRSTPRAR